MANRIKNHVCFLIVLYGCAACGNPAAKSDSKASISEHSNTAIFQLSTAPPVAIGTPEGNWCHAEYGASLLVNAEKINTNRRYFYLPAGVTKMIAGPAGTTATLLLKPLANGNVAIFTGANFPECLSAPANLSIEGNDAVWRYNNRKNIDFQFDLQVENGQFKVTLELPPGSNYAMSVNHCPECR